MLRFLTLSVICLSISIPDLAPADELRFAKIISDNMVLQSGKPITI